MARGLFSMLGTSLAFFFLLVIKETKACRDERERERERES